MKNGKRRGAAWTHGGVAYFLSCRASVTEVDKHKHSRKDWTEIHGPLGNNTTFTSTGRVGVRTQLFALVFPGLSRRRGQGTESHSGDDSQEEK